jgi:hypothetical protein
VKTAEGGLRVVLMTNQPAPYRIAFLNELARRCRLLVTFDTKREPNRDWLIEESELSFDWLVTRGLMIRRPHMPGRFAKPVLLVPLNTLAVLERFRPDVIVSSELGARTMWAALYCLIRRCGLIVFWDGYPGSDGTGRLRTLRRTLLLRRVNRVWGTGAESARSLARYGVPRERVDLEITGINTAFWRKAVDHERTSARAQVRAELALRGAVLLFVGSVDRRKGVPEMLAAFSALADIRDVPPWSVLIVGEGPLGNDVDRWAEAHPEVPVVRTGFVQSAFLPKYYAAADIFVLASLEDPWPTVCLEALIAGLPQVTSSFVGSVSDLILSGDIGDSVDPRDTAAFAQRLASRIRRAPTLVPDSARNHASETWSPSSAVTRGLTSIRSCLEDERST